REARFVHRMGAAAQLVALAIDLDQIAGANLVPQQAVRIDEERLLPRHPQGDVVVDRFRPAEHVEDAVARGEFLPRGPLRVAALDMPPELRCHDRAPLGRRLTRKAARIHSSPSRRSAEDYYEYTLPRVLSGFTGLCSPTTTKPNGFYLRQIQPIWCTPQGAI